MLASRIVTAAVLLAGFLATLFVFDRIEFGMVVAVVVAIAAHEWARLCDSGIRGSLLLAGAITAAYCILAGLIVFSGNSGILFTVSGFAAVFWVAAVPVLLKIGLERVSRLFMVATGFAVLVPAGLAMVRLHPWELLVILGLVWLADTGAYAAGRMFGRRRLAPSISPGKTWEGVFGAMLATITYAIICAIFLPVLSRQVGMIGWVPYLIAAVALCAVSVLGDLFESAVKRRASVKDSGRLLPGHGGVLDRIDSATAVLPIAVLVMEWIAPG